MHSYSFYFKLMLDVIFAIGPGYKGPNYHQLRVNLLKDAKKEVQLLVDSYRAIWAKVGCTIMGDGWTDNRQKNSSTSFCIVLKEYRL